MCYQLSALVDKKYYNYNYIHVVNQWKEQFR